MFYMGSRTINCFLVPNVMFWHLKIYIIYVGLNKTRPRYIIHFQCTLNNGREL